MNKKALKKLVIKIIERLKRQGFTFVEAMCCIILMGYAIMPIMGVMHNASRQADRVVHRYTLERLARSRLNEEIGCGMLDGKNFNTTPLTYVVYQYEGSEHKLNYFEKGDLYEHDDENNLITEAAIASIGVDINEKLCTTTPPPRKPLSKRDCEWYPAYLRG